MSESTNDPRSMNMKIKMAEHFEEFETEYRTEPQHHEVVHEDDELRIVADHTGHELNEWADDFDMERSELVSFFTDVARNRCGYNWSTSDPVVFDKFEDDC